MPSLVDQIRHALAKRDGVNEATMRSLAETYGAESLRVNARLATAMDLLRKGLRSEALQSAAAVPNAMEGAVVLDFAEAEEWFDILQFLGIPVPERPRVELVDELSDALNEAQPLENLLRNYRRLSLARGSIQSRLKTLRRISALDPFTVAWAEDVSIFEGVRKSQLKVEIDKALEGKNYEQLQALHAELADTSWHSAPDPKLLRAVSEGIAKLKNTHVLSELHRLAPQLYDAFAQYDESLGRQLYAEWTKLHGDFAGELPEELQEKIAPVVEWIEELDRGAAEQAERAQLIGKLEAALDKNLPLNQLEQAYFKATQFEEPPPDELLRRFHLAVEGKKLGKRRQFQLAVVALVSVALCIAGVFAWWQTEATRARRVGVATARFASLLEGGNLDGARAFYDDLLATDPRTAADTGVIAQAGQLQELEKKEADRAKEFANYLQSADAAEDREIDLLALGKAEALAISEGEKGAVFAIRTRHQKWQAEVARQDSEMVRRGIEEQRANIQSIEEGSISNDAIVGLDGVILALQSLRNDHPTASTQLFDQINREVERAKSIRAGIISEMERARREEFAYAAVQKSASLEELARNIERYRNDFPSSPLAMEFARALDERPLWSEPEKWNEHLRRASGVLVGELLDPKAVAFRESQAGFQYANHPAATPKVLLALDRIASAEQRIKIINEVLVGLDETIFMSINTVIIKQTNDRVFLFRDYADKNDQRLFGTTENGQIGCEIIVSKDGTARNQSLTGPLQRIFEPNETLDLLVGTGKTSANKILQDWDGEFLRLAGELITKRPNLDHQVKEILLQHLLAGACEGSERLQKELSSILVDLNSRQSVRDSWFMEKPFKPKLDQELERAVVAKLAELYRGRQQPAEDLAVLKQSKFQWIGFLTKKSTQKIEPYLPKQIEMNGKLYVVVASAAGPREAQWVEIGSISGGTIKRDPAMDSQIAGRPIFLLLES